MATYGSATTTNRGAESPHVVVRGSAAPSQLASDGGGDVVLPEAVRSVRGRQVTFIGKDAAGIPHVGLTPTWSVYLDAVANTTLPDPTITNLGGGNYKFTASGNNPAGILDLGSLANPRYVLYAAFSSVYVFAAFALSNGAPLPGLSPTWHSLKKADGSNYTPQPSINQLSGGLYGTEFIQERVSGVIDLGATASPQYVPYNNERAVVLIPIGED